MPVKPLSANALYLQALLREETGMTWVITADERDTLAAEFRGERVEMGARFNGGNPVWRWRKAPIRLRDALRGGFPVAWESGCA